MRTKTLQPMLTALTALLLAGPATAQGGNFTVDGDPMDWGGMCCFDERNDVVPDTNSAVDLRGYEIGGGRIFGGDTLFTFLFQFRAPLFQGTEETTVEIFVDLSESDTYGVEQGPWSDFRPDYVIGVTGSNGALTKEFYWRYTGSAWDKKEGADIPELDVAFATRYLEGALDWKRLDIPDTDRPYYEVKSRNSYRAVRVSKGVFRDYVPDSDQPLRKVRILPTAVESDTWGGIKNP